MPTPDPSKTEPEELDGEMRPSDIVEILRNLHFGRDCRYRDAQRLISLDAEVRDFLVRLLPPAGGRRPRLGRR
jgi:hypothetical protein